MEPRMQSEGQGSSQVAAQGSNKPAKTGGKDPCWAYGERVGNDATKVKCKFCLQTVSGGISRFKTHLAGVRGNCTSCDKVPEDVKKKASEILQKARKSKDEKELKAQDLLDDVHIGEEEVYEGSVSLLTQRSSSSFKTKGPMDAFASRSPEETTELVSKGKQPVMDSKYRKKAREDVNKYIGRWFYESGIAFNTSSLPSFKQMVHAIAKFGGYLNPPSPYELRETILQREVDATREVVEHFKKNCALNGCSIMTDAWSDRKMRSIMNIVVHSQGGCAFLASKDASGNKHDGNYILDFVVKAIEEVGSENVVQIITDGASNNMKAAKSLLLIKPNIFWTTCAAHTINLMLGDIAKIRPIRNAITMGRTVSVYIYSHTRSLHIMRDIAKGDLVRSGATRFATAFLALESLRDKKKELKQMFVSNDWMECELSTKEAGKKVAEIILSNKFWDNVDLALTIFSPLVKVLRRVDGDKTPSMGHVYGDLLVAKKEIKEGLKDEEKKYCSIWKIIDKRSDDKLKGPLHRAGYYLNPYYYYPSIIEIEKDGRFMSGVVDCLNKFYPNDNEAFTKIPSQLSDYQHKKGSFGREVAMTQAKRYDLNPVDWWKLFGTDAPELRMMAMRILSLTTSSSACERNWSTFEMIHTKKRNRLTHKKLHDLVYVKFNAKLKNKHANRDRDPLLAYDDEERSSEWLMNIEKSGRNDESDDEVFVGESLTWRQMGEFSGANPKKRKSARTKTYRRRKKSGESSSKGKALLEDDMVEEEDMETSSSESDTEEAMADIPSIDSDED